jgi:hypothetical protein
MNTEPTKPGHGVHSTDADCSVRPSMRRAAWLLGLLCLGLLAVVWFARRPAGQSAQDTTPAPSEGVVLTPSTTPQRAQATAGQPTQPQTLFVEPAADMRQLVNRLVNLQPAGGMLPEEQAAAWRTNLQQLLGQGAAAVPAIREFLLQNTDFDFGPNGQQILGYSTARSAMIDVLAQIGGPLAVAALAEVLQITADPREIALLGQSLERLDPGLHQQQVLDAARQSLAMAAEGNLAGRDVAPLFEAFQKYGGAGVAGDLARSAQTWNYYAMIALARLPDGAGISSLAQFADGQGGATPDAKAPALKMLAEAAVQSPDARAALVDLARQNKLSANDWAVLEPSLAGQQIVFQNSALDNSVSAVSPNDLRATYISVSNQRLYTAPLGAMTADQISQQEKLIDELLSVTPGGIGAQRLQQARAQLEQRLPLIAGASGK